VARDDGSILLAIKSPRSGEAFYLEINGYLDGQPRNQAIQCAVGVFQADRDLLGSVPEVTLMRWTSFAPSRLGKCSARPESRLLCDGGFVARVWRTSRSRDGVNAAACWLRMKHVAAVRGHDHLVWRDRSLSEAEQRGCCSRRRAFWLATVRYRDLMFRDPGVSTARRASNKRSNRSEWSCRDPAKQRSCCHTWRRPGSDWQRTATITNDHS